MATKDFITKKRTNNRPIRRKTKPKMSPIKKWLLWLLFIGLACLAYLIYANSMGHKKQINDLSKSISSAKNTVVQEWKQVASSATAEPKPLPDKPEEKWHYIDDLKTKEVAINEVQVNEVGSFIMKCGAFKSLKQAQKLSAKIAFQGMSNTIKPLVVPHKKDLFHEVVLGPYHKRVNAEKDKLQLQRNGIETCGIHEE